MAALCVAVPAGGLGAGWALLRPWRELSFSQLTWLTSAFLCIFKKFLSNVLWFLVYSFHIFHKIYT